MKSVRLNIGKTDEKQIASCIKCIAGNVSESEIVEIVLKTPEPVAASSKESECYTVEFFDIAAQATRPGTYRKNIVYEFPAK